MTLRNFTTFLPPIRRLMSMDPTARIMCVAVLVNSLGSGLFLPLSALYFTTAVGLTPAELAAGLGTGAFAGALAGVPFGILADRVGARNVLIVLLLATAAVIPVYLAVTNFWQFTVVVSTIRALDRGVSGIAAALVTNVIPGAAQRTEVRALLRTCLAMGLTTGSALATIALSVNSPAAYRIAILADAITFALAAIMYVRLPARKALPRTASTSTLEVLKDVPFLGITATFSLLGAYNYAVAFALPIWAVKHTSLPHGFISAAFIVNTGGHLLLQVPMARRAKTIKSALRMTVVGGVLLSAACLLFSWTSVGRTPIAATLLLVAVVLNLLGGLGITSAQFFITSDVAPDSAQGQYQGFVSTGMAVSGILAPTLFATLPLAHAGPGWMVMSLLFLLVASIVPVIVRAGLRRSNGQQLESHLQGSVNG
ncbi:MFS transporter [Streptomyces sp. MMS24-I2-30]|uniref:MFS transporter n=1 Tax=Streptomyces sp. MMS24-I2-30 TaxID=3351564 RepID=UPI003896ADED